MVICWQFREQVRYNVTMPVETRAPSAPGAAGSFARRLAVETPEHVVIELELAGMGSRAAAALYDALAVLIIFI